MQSSLAPASPRYDSHGSRTLPLELVREIFKLVCDIGMSQSRSVSILCRWAYSLAQPFLWRTIVVFVKTWEAFEPFADFLAEDDERSRVRRSWIQNIAIIPQCPLRRSLFSFYTAPEISAAMPALMQLPTTLPNLSNMYLYSAEFGANMVPVRNLLHAQVKRKNWKDRRTLYVQYQSPWGDTYLPEDLKRDELGQNVTHLCLSSSHLPNVLQCITTLRDTTHLAMAFPASSFLLSHAETLKRLPPRYKQVVFILRSAYAETKEEQLRIADWFTELHSSDPRFAIVWNDSDDLAQWKCDIWSGEDLWTRAKSDTEVYLRQCDSL